MVAAAPAATDFSSSFPPRFSSGEISGRAWGAAGGEVKLKTMTYGQRRVGKSKCFSVQKEVAW